jgi:type I protein arginine methyltransferase
VLEHVELITQGTRTTVLVDTEDRASTGPTLLPSVGEYPVLDAGVYDKLAGDDLRNQRYRRALHILGRDKVIYDLGAGDQLLWSREALTLGASKAIAVEVQKETYALASEKLASLGLEDRITLHLGDSMHVELGDKADVCVADIIGTLAGAEGSAAVFADARRRHLNPDARFIPHRAVTRAAATCLRELFHPHPVAFAREAVSYLERIFEYNTKPFDVRLRIKHPNTDAIVSTDQEVEILDYNGDLKVQQRTQARLQVLRPGQVDGILTWLQLWCLPDEAPLDSLRQSTNWSSVYFPLFPEPIDVKPGDSLDLVYDVRLSEDGIHPDYAVSAQLTTSRATFTGAFSAPRRGEQFRASPQYAALFPV